MQKLHQFLKKYSENEKTKGMTFFGQRHEISLGRRGVKHLRKQTNKYNK